MCVVVTAVADDNGEEESISSSKCETVVSCAKLVLPLVGDVKSVDFKPCCSTAVVLCTTAAIDFKLNLSVEDVLVDRERVSIPRVVGDDTDGIGVDIEDE